MDSSRDYERVERALRFVEQHQADQPSLAEVAHAAGLSAGRLQRLFLRWAGVSPKTFLQFLTKEAAKEALARESVLGASHAIGLSGPSRLHDLMVRTEAMTPGEVRAKGAGVVLRWGTASSPFGPFSVAGTKRGLTAAAFGNDPLIGEWPNADIVRDDGWARGITQRIFEGEPSKPLGVWLRGTPFQLKVWEAVLAIGSGQVASYGEVAASVGKPDAARAVGAALGANRLAMLVPCHRVIRSIGEAGGYRWGLTRKRAMLAWERAREA